VDCGALPEHKLKRYGADKEDLAIWTARTQANLTELESLAVTLERHLTAKA